MLGRLHHDVADGVEAGPPGAAGDLVELPGPQHPLLAPVVLRQRGEQHGADRHVDADAEGVGAADDGEQAGLREGLDEPPVLRQHPRVVHPDPVQHQPAQGHPESLAEAEAAHGILDRGLARARDELDAGQRLGLLHRGRLGERHDVDRPAVVAQQQLDRLVHGRENPRELQRHRPFRAGDGHGLAAGAAGEVLLEHRRLAERRRHEQELGVGHEQQRHLPGPPAVGLGVEVELVHDDEPDVGELAVAQRVVGEHLGGRADDRGAGVDRRVAGEHADPLGPEDLDEREELLADQGLDRRGVPAAPALGEGQGVGGDRDERLARPGRGGQHDVGPAGEGEHRLLLRGVQGEAPLPGPVDEDVERRVRAGGGGAGEAVGEGHRARLSPS